MFSIIIPFKYTKERLPLLETVCENTKKIFPHHPIWIHETDEHPKCEYLIQKYNINYKFTHNKGIFSRAYCINKIIKENIFSEYTIILDSDIILTEKFKSLLSNVKNDVYYIGWNKLYMLDKDSTHNLCENKKSKLSHYLVKTPHYWLGSAGGVNIINTSLFKKIKGVPEDFKNTWGGPDNAICLKLNKLGYNIESFNCELYHLYHANRIQLKKQFKTKKLHEFNQYSKEDWLNYLNNTTFGD